MILNHRYIKSPPLIPGALEHDVVSPSVGVWFQERKEKLPSAYPTFLRRRRARCPFFRMAYMLLLLVVVLLGTLATII